MKQCLCFICTAFLVLAPLQAAVYVNQDRGSDSGPGTLEQPVKTLARGVALMRQNKDYSLEIAESRQPYYESLILSNMTPPPGKRLTVDAHGAVISGLEKLTAWEKKGSLYFTPVPRWGALNPFALVDGVFWPQLKKISDLKPGQTVWAPEGLYIALPAGKKPSDYQIFGTVKESGVKIINTSYVTVKNIRSRYFANDGFNVHGSCHDLHFQNIEASWNGDDGFSVHEDVGVNVTDAVFHHNFFGIQDVHASRSQYHRVKVYENRGFGVHFLGGFHSLIDSEIHHNTGYELIVTGNAVPNLKLEKTSHLVTGNAYISNCRIHDGEVGVAIMGQARVTLARCVLERIRTRQKPADTDQIIWLP